MPGPEPAVREAAPRLRHWGVIGFVAVVLLLIGTYFANPLHTASRDPRLRLLGYSLYRMPSLSMQPTIEEGAIFPVSAWPYRQRGPERGDIIVFRYPPDPSVAYIKRVVGIGGDVVSVSGCMATVNGKLLAEGDYIGTLKDPASEICNRRAQTVPADQYYVLGDSRENSADSRIWGYVPRANVIGRAYP